MDFQSNVVHAIVNEPGRITSAEGDVIRVTFSLYAHQEFGEDAPGAKPAEGLCRVSDGSGALEALLEQGAAVLLTSDELYATIHLTSRCTFMVAGPVFKR